MHTFSFKYKFSVFVAALISLFIINYSLLIRTVSAHCPLCVAGAAAGLSLTRFLGIDDSITGIWIGALLGAFSFWFDNYLAKKRGKRFKYSKEIIFLASFVLTIWSFYAFNDYTMRTFSFYLINTHVGQILGFDKLIFGLISGGLLFYFIDIVDNYLIKINGKVYFPYQRVIVSLGSVLVWSVIVYVLINFYI